MCTTKTSPRAHGRAVCTVSRTITHDAGAHVYVAFVRLRVFGLMIFSFFLSSFLRSGLADIEMDGPYALYGPCIFHIPAKPSSAASVSTAGMLRWDVG